MSSKSIIKDIAIVVVGVIIIWLGLQVVFGTQNPFYVVSSESMVPELLVYDIIVVQGNDPFEEVQVGDIIVFNRPSGHDRVIVHRVVSIVDDDPYTVRAQGDANPSSIPGTDFPITADEYIGTVAYVIPQVGFITRIFATQIGGIPLNYIIIAIVIGVMITRQVIKKKMTDEVKKPKIDPKPVDLGKLDIPKDTQYLEKRDTIQDSKDDTGLKDQQNDPDKKID